MLQTDGGVEFINNKMRQHLIDHGIHHRISCPYTPEQNGIAERKHRHLIELGLSMMFYCHLPLKYWVEAFYIASYVCNFLPVATRENKSPSEVLQKEAPEYGHLRVFGSACYPYLHPVAEHKFEPRSLLCVFLGYSSQYKGYRCLYPPTGKVYITQHVIFDETLFPFKEQYKSLVPQYATSLLRAWQQATSPIQPPKVDQVSRFLPAAMLHPQAPAAPTPVAAALPPDPLPQAVPVVEVAAPVAGVHQVNQHPMRTHAKSGILKPNTRYVLLTSKLDTKKPRNIREAMAHPEWNHAVTEEMVKIHTLHTWTLVPQTPDMNIVSSGWVYTDKLTPDGKQKPRARLVAKGFQQEKGRAFLETFSPVVRTATIRLMLNIAVAKD